jgi:hypothetical protein
MLSLLTRSESVSILLYSLSHRVRVVCILADVLARISFSSEPIPCSFNFRDLASSAWVLCPDEMAGECECTLFTSSQRDGRNLARRRSCWETHRAQRPKILHDLSLILNQLQPSHHLLPFRSNKFTSTVLNEHIENTMTYKGHICIRRPDYICGCDLDETKVTRGCSLLHFPYLEHRIGFPEQDVEG